MTISLSRLAAAVLLFATAALPAATPAATDPKPVAPKRPAIKVDASPVSDGKSPAVASYADVVDPVQKAVVSIYSTILVKAQAAPQLPPALRQFFGNQEGEEEKASKERGLGSGVIVSADGYILTNNHVVADAEELQVQLADNRTFSAKVIGTDPKTDVAIIKIEASNLPTITFADSDKLRVGDVVFAVGNPLDIGETVTMGIISAKGRQVGILQDIGGYENFIQTDAAINMGNSGGALVDAKGRLIGINSAILSPSRGNIGIGFAIPINLVTVIMNSLIETGTVNRGFLGVSTCDITPDLAEQFGLPKETKGVAITEVTKATPAEKAGLRVSDVIVTIDGKDVSSVDELRLTIATMVPGTKTSIKLFRDAKPMTVDVTLSKVDDKPDDLLEGVTVGRLTDELRRKFVVDPNVKGLLVTDVADNSPFADVLTPGVVIVEIDRTPVTELTAAVSILRPGHNLFLINFRGVARYIVVTK